ncbi:peptidase S8/S53 domain-containing protein [Rostrohypoxylon terebratum]|nr:peptidase S8/S53 domain-containing protein [Rostrohypoxylon terebratum]
MEPGPSSLDVEETYVIYPRDGTNKDQTNTIGEILTQFAKPLTVYVSQTRTVGINFWLATLNEKQAISIAHELAPEASLVTNSHSAHLTYKMTYYVTEPKINHQHLDKGRDFDYLRFVCQEPEKSLEETPHYYYDVTEPILGNGIPVYIVDTGATLHHKEFDKVRGNVEWIHVGEDVGGGHAEDDSSVDPAQGNTGGKGHGTAMLSLVTGKTLGISKGVKPYIIRMPRRHIPGPLQEGRPGHATNEDWLEGVSRVNDHLAERIRTAKAITLLAFHIPQRSFHRNGVDHSAGFDARMRFLLMDLVRKGALPITGSGNAFKPTIDGFPANYGRSDYDPIPEVLVVRGVHPTSFNLAYQTDFAQGLPHIFAPALNVRCAEGNHDLWNISKFRRGDGTSCAAAITAGLAAYVLRLGQVNSDHTILNTPLSLKNYILSLSWSRMIDHGRPLPAIWNGLRRKPSFREDARDIGDVALDITRDIKRKLGKKFSK